MNQEIKMSVSPVCVRDGKRFAYVSFSDGTRSAEGRIPDCVITSNKGFTQGEAALLEHYMKQELKNLKKMASGVNVMRAFMKDGE